MTVPSPRHRGRLLGTAIVVATSVAVVDAAPWTVPAAVSAGAALMIALWWPGSRRWLAPATVAAGGLSLAATVAHVAGPWPGSPPWGMVEIVLLSTLVAMAVRWAPGRSAAMSAVVAGVAAATSLLRATPDGESAELAGLDALYAVSFWALGPILAAAFGLLLRHQGDQRARAVAAAQRAQRLDLARDLHDYVAHDVSEMIAQAQAASMVADADHPAGEALHRIEVAGLRAMASMDRTVRVLSDPDTADADEGDARRPRAGLEDLPALTERFAAAGSARVLLLVDDDLARWVPRELAGTVHRVVVEALTNIRRHAPAATLVEVRVGRSDGDLEVAVTDDGGGTSTDDQDRRGGLGLPGLTERVGMLAGTLRAGRHGPGWQVVARLPLPGPSVDGRQP